MESLTLVLPAIAGWKPAVSWLCAGRPTATVGDRRGGLWEKATWLRHRDAPLVDPVHHLRANAGRHQACPARDRTTGCFRSKEFLQRDRLLVESGELGDTQDLPPAISQPSNVHQ